MVPANDTERQLLDLMTNYRFNLMGSMRSMMEFLRGLSISFSLASLVMGTVNLLLSRERSGLLKRVAMVNAIWLAALTAVSFASFLRHAHCIYRVCGVVRLSQQLQEPLIQKSRKHRC